MHDRDDEISALLRGLDETMPPSVAERLGRVVTNEVRRRRTGQAADALASAQAAAAKRTSLGTFGENVPDRLDLKRVHRHAGAATD